MFQILELRTRCTEHARSGTEEGLAVIRWTDGAPRDGRPEIARAGTGNVIHKQAPPTRHGKRQLTLHA